MAKKKQQVLIIEDDEIMARLYEKIFALNGYDPIIAYGGKEGIEKAKELSPELILLDLMMPKIDGFEVLDKLKLEASTKDIPVVVLTNLAEEENRVKAMDKGAVRYLVKSEFEPKDVVKQIKNVLSGDTEEES